MKRFFILFSFLVFCFQISNAQSDLPILKTNSKNLSIRDGEMLRMNYWGVNPKIELDVYVADKFRDAKVVTFYSDIDSISFTIQPNTYHDFVVVVEGKDSCLTRVESGIKFLAEELQNQTPDTIPFTLTPYNNISIEAVINGQDTAKLMFHTAANSVGLTNEAVKRFKDFKIDEKGEGNAWGGSGQMNYSESNKVQIGNLVWDDIEIFTGEYSGHLTDGKFGTHLFPNKIIEINFDEKLLIVHNKLPNDLSGFEKMDLVFNRSMMFIKGKCQIGEQLFDNQFLIHSGYSKTILFDDQFVSQHQLGSELETVKVTELKDSFGNILKTKESILPKLVFGNNEFGSIPVGLFEGAIGRQKMSVVGGDILKRFNIILDTQNAYVYLKPSSMFSDEFEKG